MQGLVFPSTLVAPLGIFGFHLFRPIASAGIADIHACGFAGVHAFQQFHDVRFVEHLFVHNPFPEVGHGREGVVATHGPHGVGIRSGDKNVLHILQGQDAVVLQQYHRLGCNVVGRLSFLGRVQCNLFGAVQIRILVKEAGEEFVTEHILHCPFQHLGLH